MGEEELKFTGNWFIDAGILGFVNLMEEVYGWDLEELQRRIKTEPEKVYYGYFPLAYFYKLSKNKKQNITRKALQLIEQSTERGRNLLEKVWWNLIVDAFEDDWLSWKLGKMHEKELLDNKTGKLKPEYEDERYRELIRKREDALNKLNECEESIRSLLGKRRKFFENNKHKFTLEELEALENAISRYERETNNCLELTKDALDVHKELKKYLKSLWGEIKANQSVLVQKSRFFRIPVDSGFYKNYLFFNYSRGILEQLEDTWNLINGNAEYSKYLSKIDKTLSKFLPSDSEFSNIYYTPLRIEPLLQYSKYIFVYLLNFLNAFNRVGSIGYMFFYGSTLEFSYHVNKRLKVLLTQVSEKRSIFRVTWQAVIDTITEEKAKWSLENMYLIQFQGINQQNLVNVEYIGIPKLHASVILDDNIREALNSKLPIKIKGNSKSKPKEKLKNSDFESIWLLEEFLRQRPLYPLIIKHVWNGIKNGFLNRKASLYALAIDSKLRQEGTFKAIFDKAFFERPKRAAVEVKDFYKDMSYVAMIIKEVSSEIGGDNLIHPLFSALRRHDRNAFVNTLLKALLQAKSKDKVTTINNYLFRRVLSNDTSWEDFALALVVGLVGGGEDVGSGEDVEED